MPLLSIESGSKYFAESVGLFQISLAIESGESVCVVGRNGAGKSTLLRCLSGLQRLDEGKVNNSAQRVAYVGDEAALYADLNLLENFELVAACAGLSGAASYIEELISTFDIEEHSKKPLRFCSKGVSQKAAIIRALLLRPQLLLLDEPFANLDSEGREVLSTFVEEIVGQGASVVMAVHEEEIVSRHGERVLELANGRLRRDWRRG